MVPTASLKIESEEDVESDAGQEEDMRGFVNKKKEEGATFQVITIEQMRRIKLG